MKLLLIDPSRPEGAARIALLAARLEIERSLRDREALAAVREADPLDETLRQAERDIAAREVGALTVRWYEIKDALCRLEFGAWGVCEGCGEQIPPKRLKALPWAALCVDCQSESEMEVTCES